MDMHESIKDFSVLREVHPEVEKKGWLKHDVTFPGDFSNDALWQWWKEKDGKEHFEKIAKNVKNCNGNLLNAVKRGGRFFAVSTQAIDITIVVDNVCEEDGYAWFYRIVGKISVLDPAHFIREFEGFCNGDGVQVSLFSAYLAGPLKTDVRDKLHDYMQRSGHGAGEMSRDTALGTEYWNKVFERSPILAGCRFIITDVGFFVPGREFEEENKRLMDAEIRVREAEQEARRAPLDALRMDVEQKIAHIVAEGEVKLKQLEVNAKLKKAQDEYAYEQQVRNNELRRVMDQEHKAREEIRTATKQVSEDMPNKVAEVQTVVAGNAKEPSASQLVPPSNETNGGQVPVATKTMGDTGPARVKLLFQQLRSGNPAKRIAAMKELMSPAFGFSKKDLLRIAGQSELDPSLTLLETLKNRNAGEGENGRVSIVKKDMEVRTRSVGIVKNASVATVSKGRALNFTISSGKHAGFLTVLNIDSHGDVNLLVPNGETTDSHIDGQAKSDIPGKPYFDSTSSLMETSDEGIEHIAAIVSEYQLLPKDVVERLALEQRNSSKETIVLLTLTDAEVLSLNNTLRRLSIEKYSVGMLSFHVSK